MPERAPLAVGIAGLGNIGTEVARWLVADAPPGLRLAAAGGREPAAVAARLAALGATGARATSLAQLLDHCDVLVDCLEPGASATLLETCVDSGKTLVPVSVCVLLLDPGLLERARAAGTRVLVPSGAIAGLDALRAAALGRIDSIRVRTSKPPAGLQAEAGADPRPQRLFAGNAFDACRAWPRNVNIAATLALAGVGGERTEVEIWSDPALTRNVHEIEIDSDSTALRIRIENRPSAANPRSSALTAQSVCALLLGLVAPVRVGA
jgi:aspartate dehydrogenase